MEKFKNEVLVKLESEGVDKTTLLKVKQAIEVIGSKYDVTVKETALATVTYTLPELAKTYLVSRKIEGIADSTLKQYKLRLEHFFSTINKQPQDITTNDIRVYLFQFEETRNVSNRTLDGVRTIINSFFNWCVDEDYIGKKSL